METRKSKHISNNLCRRIVIDNIVYYIFGTTESNQNAINKAIEDKRINNALQFSKGLLSLENFSRHAIGITMTSIVLPAFYAHIWKPDKLPIFDEKVWKVYQQSNGTKISSHTKPQTWNDYITYVKFFNRFLCETCLDWRTLDRSLWVLGNNIAVENIQSSEAISKKEIQKTKIVTNIKLKSIPSFILDKACNKTCNKIGNPPLKERHILITRELVQTTMEILNLEPTKCLPQNCRNDIVERTPDGLDKRIKIKLHSDLRTANIISDMLANVGIVEITK